MTEQSTNDHQLGRMFRNLPERQPPEDLVNNIMTALSQSSPPAAEEKKCSRLHSFFLQFQRGRIVTSCFLFALAFWLGLTAGNVWKDHDTAPSTSLISDADIYGNAEASFLYGRSLLAAGKDVQALAMFQHASLLSPDKPEYLFWLGAAYWSTGNLRGEQDSYLKALQVEEDFLPALVHLGHLQLENNAPQAALKFYTQVLSLIPTQQESLYNVALANHLLGKKQPSIDAWKAYLQLYRSGKRAYRAVEHLNSLGEFSYRSYQIGGRRIIVNQEVLLGPLNSEKLQEITYLADHIKRARVTSVELVVFHDAGLIPAKQQAMTLKNRLEEALKQPTKQIRMSWFGEPETIQTMTGTRSLENSLLFFSQLQSTQTKEETI